MCTTCAPGTEEDASEFASNWIAGVHRIPDVISVGPSLIDSCIFGLAYAKAQQGCALDLVNPYSEDNLAELTKPFTVKARQQLLAAAEETLSATLAEAMFYALLAAEWALQYRNFVLTKGDCISSAKVIDGGGSADDFPYEGSHSHAIVKAFNFTSTNVAPHILADLWLQAYVKDRTTNRATAPLAVLFKSFQQGALGLRHHEYDPCYPIGDLMIIPQGLRQSLLSKAMVNILEELSVLAGYRSRGRDGTADLNKLLHAKELIHMLDGLTWGLTLLEGSLSKV